MDRFRVELDAPACIVLALGILILPVDWLFCWMLAAILHEAGHAAAILLAGGRIHGLRIGTAGAVMEAELGGRKQEFLCALAGPAVSLLLVFAGGEFPKIAACALLQGLFNLLPFYPLDGGRIMRCLVDRKVSRVVEAAAVGALFFAAIWVSVLLRLGIFPILAAAAVSGKAFLRKIPCKEA